MAFKCNHESNYNLINAWHWRITKACQPLIRPILSLVCNQLKCILLCTVLWLLNGVQLIFVHYTLIKEYQPGDGISSLTTFFKPFRQVTSQCFVAIPEWVTVPALITIIFEHVAIVGCFYCGNCRDRINSVQHNKYHGCWCPDILRYQDIGTHDIDYVE